MTKTHLEKLYEFSYHHQLCPNQQKVFLLLVADYLTNDEIAERIGVTEKTVRHHFTRIYKKTRAKSKITLLGKVFNFVQGYTDVSGMALSELERPAAG